MRKFYLFIISVIFVSFFVQTQAEQKSDMRFIENKGQWGNDIAFSTPLSFGNIYFEKNNFTFILHDLGKLSHHHHEGNCTHENHENLSSIKAHHYKIEFEGAHANPQFETSEKSDYYYNYFQGNNPNFWGSKAHAYEAITYKSIYNGIDLKVFGSGENMKYEYYVAPGVNPDIIREKITGIEQILLADGNLEYTTNAAQVKHLKPFVYQFINGRKKIVKCRYKLDSQSNTVTYVFPAGYDTNHELVIDPTLIFSSYTGSQRDNFGFTATYDNAGNLYGGGMVRDFVFAGGEYPITPGAFDGTFNGVVDIAISVFSPDGTSLIYSTFVGGSDGDIPNSMIVNNNNELVVLATTGSANFPVTANAYIDTFSGGVNANYLGGYGVVFNNGSDIAVFKLSADGTQLLASTYMGGSDNDGINDDGDLTFAYDGTDIHYNYGDVFRGEITVDPNNNVYIVSSTNSSNFPTTLGVAKDTLSGIQDVVSFKLNSDLSGLMWSTYFGGENLDAGYSQKVDIDGNVVLCGGTNSPDFPTTPGALSETYSGGLADGFIAKLSGNDGSLIASTLLGTAEYDQAFMIDVDAFNNVYVVGQTEGAYPIQTPGYSNPGSSQFIHKLNPDLSTTFFSTVYGNGTNQINISPTAFQVDICERIYVSGWGGTVNRNNRNSRVGFTQNMPITPDALRNESQTDGSDFHIVVFEKNLNGILYGTYLGGPAAEHVDGGTSRFDKNAIIYQAVCAGCGGNSTFPTTPGVVSQTNNSPNCNLAVLKMDIELPSTQVNVNAYPTLTGCVPLTVNFEGELINVSSFQWDFGDGNTSNDVNPVHIYEDIGIYTVQLIGIDSNSCNVADTAYLEVVVGDNRLDPNFQDSIFIDCGSLTVFIDGPTNYPATQYFWNMGDGNVYTTQNVTHTYNVPGDYTIHLYLEDTTSCNPFDSTEFTIHIPPIIDFSITTTDTSGCIPLTVDFEVNSTSSSATFLWNFENGTNSSSPQTTHDFITTGTHIVYLYVADSNSCNLLDSAQIEITTRNDGVTAFYTANILNNCDSLLSIELNNESTNAINFFWVFETGTSTIENPETYQYFLPGTYTITLIAENQDLCYPLDTFSMEFTMLPNIEAFFEALPNCETLPISIDNLSPFFTENVVWNFGNGQTSSEWQPEYIYPQSGTYTISLTLTDAGSCNGSSTYSQEIEIAVFPQANFTTDSNYYIYPDAVQFFNQSTDFDDFIWSFGDGFSNTEDLNPLHIFRSIHDVTNCLTVSNEWCADTICKDIFIDFIRLIGVPNAFSPNNDGINDRIFVKGDGIVVLNFKIYNRWGEVVFETNDQSVGWDGTYKGVPQEMEVYTYIVDALFLDGENIKLTGNITLLR